MPESKVCYSMYIVQADKGKWREKNCSFNFVIKWKQNETGIQEIGIIIWDLGCEK